MFRDGHVYPNQGLCANGPLSTFPVSLFPVCVGLRVEVVGCTRGRRSVLYYDCNALSVLRVRLPKEGRFVSLVRIQFPMDSRGHFLRSNFHDCVRGHVHVVDTGVRRVVVPMVKFLLLTISHCDFQLYPQGVRVPVLPFFRQGVGVRVPNPCYF